MLWFLSIFVDFCCFSLSNSWPVHAWLESKGRFAARITILFTWFKEHVDHNNHVDEMEHRNWNLTCPTRLSPWLRQLHKLPQIIMLLYYYITILLYYYITVLLYYYITLLLSYYITMLLYYYITIILYYYITILLYYYITILLY